MFKYVSGIGRVKLSEQEISEIFDNQEDNQQVFKPDTEISDLKKKLDEIYKMIEAIKNSSVVKSFISSELASSGNE